MRTTSFRVRTALVTWLAVYPIITMLLVVLEPLIDGWLLPLRTLLLTTIMVPTLVFWAIPSATFLAQRFFRTAGDEVDGSPESVRTSEQD